MPAQEHHYLVENVKTQIILVLSSSYLLFVVVIDIRHDNLEELPLIEIHIRREATRVDGGGEYDGSSP